MNTENRENNIVMYLLDLLLIEIKIQNWNKKCKLIENVKKF